MNIHSQNIPFDYMADVALLPQSTCCHLSMLQLFVVMLVCVRACVGSTGANAEDPQRDQ